MHVQEQTQYLRRRAAMDKLLDHRDYVEVLAKIARGRIDMLMRRERR
jgi:hypothetical protein